MNDFLRWLFFWAIVVGMDKTALYKFMHSTYNYAADAKMLLFFTDISQTAAITLVVLAALSVVLKNFWCRYLCPYGALLGLASLLGVPVPSLVGTPLGGRHGGEAEQCIDVAGLGARNLLI